MIYLKTFSLSKQKQHSPHIYPYNIFRDKDILPFIFSSITVLYGNNGCGKSTILNIIAHKLNLKGKEMPTTHSQFGNNYMSQFVNECKYALNNDDYGNVIHNLPQQSLYIKSEDILYEIKKIQQFQILRENQKYNFLMEGHSIQETELYMNSFTAKKQLEYEIFAQEKYSNGETALQILQNYLVPGGLYLLDEPEVSLSPQNQVQLAQEINELARFLDCQFIIATHSPFMLGILDAKIYNLDSSHYRIQKWTELPNVRYFYQFFKDKECDFN